jgi:hypothetical protein
MAKTAVFEAMMGSNLYCMSIIMCFLAHLVIGHMRFYHQVSSVDVKKLTTDDDGRNLMVKSHMAYGQVS